LHQIVDILGPVNPNQSVVYGFYLLPLTTYYT
jgi:hypothetical protein